MHTVFRMYFYPYYPIPLLYMDICHLILWKRHWFLLLKVKGDSSDKNNYRPIALVTAASKLFKICILEILEMYLVTHDQQFGFKSKHTTDMCVFTVKNIIKYYTEQNTTVYTCFLDASKAFDRLNHWTLFHK